MSVSEEESEQKIIVNEGDCREGPVARMFGVDCLR